MATPALGDSRSNLQRLLFAASLLMMSTGLVTAIGGAATLPGDEPVSASADSELRFLSAAWFGAGIFVASLARRVEARATELRVFAAIVFLGGLARLLGAADRGWPPAAQIVLLGLELVLPPVLVVWQSRVARRSPRDR